MYKYHLLTALSIALCCATAIANEEPDESPQAQAQRNAESDGAAIALAIYCSTPKATVSLYAQALMSTSKAFAVNNGVEFSDEVYKSIARHNINETIGFMNLLQPTPENKRENCAGVGKNISDALAVRQSNDDIKK